MESNIRKRRRRAEINEAPDCVVIPPHALLYQPVDFGSGGKFLKEIDRFMSRYHSGQSVLGRFRFLHPEETFESGLAEQESSSLTAQIGLEATR